MKTKEQMQTATEISKLLQDYVELAKTEKKLKFTEHRIRTESIITEIIKQVKNKAEEL